MAAGLGGLGADPFWSVVRRREPDVDIVLLPQPERPRAAVPVEASELPPLAQRLDDEAAELWLTLVEGPRDGAGRWVGGSAAESVAREARFVTQLDAATAHEALGRLGRLLTAAGWHVLAPPTGLPRVLAGREDSGVRQDLQAVHVASTGRFALTVRTGSWAPGRDAARSLRGGGR